MMAHKVVLWRFAAVLPILTCAAFIFDHNGSVEAPPRVTTKPLVLARDSTIVLPISVSLSDLARLLEQKVPARLVDIQHERRSGCVPAKYAIFCAVPRIGRRGCAVRETQTLITPAIDCELTGHVDRGPIRFAGSANRLSVVVPVSGEVTAHGRGEIGKNISVTGKGAGDASADIAADLGADWHPDVSVDPHFKWTKPPGAWVLGFWVTFADRVQPQLDQAITQLKLAVNDQVIKWNVPSLAAQYWRRGFASVRLLSNPDVWLRFAPSNVGFAPLDFSNGKINARVMLSGSTQVFVGEQPLAPAASQLPPLARELPPPQFHIAVPIFISYDTAETALRTALQVGKTQKFSVPHAGTVAVVFRNVAVFPTDGGRLAVGITLSADPPGSFFKTSGTIWLTGKLRVAADGKRLMVAPDAPFDFRGHTDSTAVNLLLAIVRLPAIKTRIESSFLNVDVSHQYDKALAQVTAALNRPLAQGLALQTVLNSVKVPDDVSASPAGIYVGLEVNGNALLLTTP